LYSASRGTDPLVADVTAGALTRDSDNPVGFTQTLWVTTPPFLANIQTNKQSNQALTNQYTEAILLFKINTQIL